MQVRFAVSDTGEGYDGRDAAARFKPFEQEDGTTARRHGGSGLGLSIVKALVEAMQGTLAVDSEKGKGTRFVGGAALCAARPGSGPRRKGGGQRRRGSGAGIS